MTAFAGWSYLQFINDMHFCSVDYEAKLIGFNASINTHIIRNEYLVNESNLELYAISIFL